MTDTLRPIVEDLQLLYELALSVGRDFDLVGNCASFVRILQNRKDIAYGAVWLKPEATGARRSQLVFAQPRRMALARMRRGVGALLLRALLLLLLLLLRLLLRPLLCPLLLRRLPGEPVLRCVNRLS